jgi:hypothetical protein
MEFTLIASVCALSDSTISINYIAIGQLEYALTWYNKKTRENLKINISKCLTFNEIVCWKRIIADIVCNQPLRRQRRWIESKSFCFGTSIWPLWRHTRICSKRTRNWSDWTDQLSLTEVTGTIAMVPHNCAINKSSQQQQSSSQQQQSSRNVSVIQRQYSSMFKAIFAHASLS